MHDLDLDLIHIGLATLIAVLIWYRVATADSTSDFVRLSAMVHYSVVFVPMAFLAFAADEVFGPEFEEFRAFYLLAILSLAIFFVSRFESLVLATVAMPMLWDTENSVRTNVITILVFLSLVAVGRFLGTWLFRKLFQARLGATEAERIARKSVR